MKNRVFIAAIAIFIMLNAGMVLSQERMMLAASDTSGIENPSDTVIITAIKGKFMADEMLKSYNVEVTCDNGSVVLSGIVPTEEHKQAMIKVAKDTVDVKEIESRLEVKP